MNQTASPAFLYYLMIHDKYMCVFLLVNEIKVIHYNISLVFILICYDKRPLLFVYQTFIKQIIFDVLLSFDPQKKQLCFDSFFDIYEH